MQLSWSGCWSQWPARLGLTAHCDYEKRRRILSNLCKNMFLPPIIASVTLSAFLRRCLLTSGTAKVRVLSITTYKNINKVVKASIWTFRQASSTEKMYEMKCSSETNPLAMWRRLYTGDGLKLETATDHLLEENIKTRIITCRKISTKKFFGIL